MALSIGFLRFVSSTDAIQATGLLTVALVGLTLTEHASLCWTHWVAQNYLILGSVICSKLAPEDQALVSNRGKGFLGKGFTARRRAVLSGQRRQ
jgi:hypothetical protein